MTQRCTLWTTAALAVCVALGSTRVAFAQDSKADVKEAYDLYQRGKNEEALKKLNEVLATNPSAEAAFDLRQTLEVRQWAELAAADEKRIGEAVMKLHELAMPAASAQTGDAASIGKLIADARAAKDDWAARQKALLDLALNHGEYAVAELSKDLNNSETERRVQAMAWIRQLGSDAALPLIQTLKSSDAMTRANAAITLGMLRDRRAAASLMRVAETDSDPTVKDAAVEALRRIGSQSGTYVEALIHLAERYYREDPRAVSLYRRVYPVWSWNGETNALVAEEVPRDLYHLKLAENTLFDARRADPTNDVAQVLMVSVLLAEAEFGRGVTGEGEGAPVAAAMKNARILAATAGPAVLDAVVQKALAEGRQDVAVAAIDLLGKMLNADAFAPHNGLTIGLGAQQRAVRYAAALAIAAIKPRGEFEGRDQVVSALAQALGEDAVRNVVVIDDNQPTRSKICAELEAKKWFCVPTDTAGTGIARLREYPIEDMVIVRYDLQRSHVSEVVRGVRADDRTKDVPVVILVSAAQADAAKKEYEGKVQAFLVYTGEPNADAYEPSLRELVKTLDPAREAATVTAAAAATALADMDPRGSGFSSASAAGALAATLKGDDRVRLPAIRALGSIADPATLDALVGVLKDTASSETIRGNAAIAIGRISRSAGVVNPEAGGALRTAALAGGSPEYMMMLAQAAGLMPLGPNTRAGMQRMYRPKLAVDLVK